MEAGWFYAMQAFFTYITFLLAFLILFSFRYDKKATFLAGMVLWLGSSITCYFCAETYPQVCRLQHTVLWLLVTGIAFLWFGARYRDGRYWFTCAGVIALEMVQDVAAVFLTAAAGQGDAFRLILQALLGIVFLAALYKMRKRYWKILEDIKKGWNALAAVSLLFLLMITAAAYYPGPLTEREEYFPVVLICCAALLLMYILILRGLEIAEQYYLERRKTEGMKRYEKLAYIDEMTGLLNRRALDEKLEKLERRKEPFVYMLLDINSLKEVNDGYGHTYGDDFIREAAAILKKYEKDSMGAYRTGGDEFVLLLPAGQQERNKKLLEELRRDSRAFFYCGEKAYGMAVGFERMEDYKKDSIENMMKRSDREMYRNKMEMKAACMQEEG